MQSSIYTILLTIFFIGSFVLYKVHELSPGQALTVMVISLTGFILVGILNKLKK